MSYRQLRYGAASELWRVAATPDVERVTLVADRGTQGLRTATRVLEPHPLEQHLSRRTAKSLWGSRGLSAGHVA